MRKRKLDCVLLLIRAGVEGLGDGAFLREALRAGDSDAAVALVKAGEDPEQEKSAKFPTSKAPISAVFHSFRLIFGRAIIARNGLEAWMLFSERARAERSR